MISRYLSQQHNDEAIASDGRKEGKYANYFVIGHNASEFLLDFGQMYSGTQEHIHSRVITSPQYARELFNVLGEAITSYERQFGTIDDLHEAPLNETPDRI